MTIFSVYIFLMMLLVGGIGVDLMLAEYERNKRQQVLDRAVLAAADLDSKLTPEAVVRDYMTKSGLDGSAISVSVQETSTSRIVSAVDRAEQDTRWMKFIGNESLPVYTASTAEQVIPKLEVSLVLDISASMHGSKITALRPAARQFVTTLLKGDLKDHTLINVVPYAGQTNPGQFMFNRLGGQRYPAAALDESEGGIAEQFNNTLLAPSLPAGKGKDPETRYVYPNVSSCLEFDETDFSHSGLPKVGSYHQVAHFMHWDFKKESMNWGWCPWDRDTTIQYAQNSESDLHDFIDGMRLSDGTGTHYAIKWGLSLLDPSTQDDFEAMANAGLIPDEFRNRPTAWGDQSAEKFLVLMTDGNISDQYRPKDTMHAKNPKIRLNQRTGDRQRITPRSTNLISFYEICNMAKDPSRNVTIFTIAFQAPSSARQEMRNCASSPSHFFDVQSSELSDAFEAIARSIRPLQLTQ